NLLEKLEGIPKTPQNIGHLELIHIMIDMSKKDYEKGYERSSKIIEQFEQNQIQNIQILGYILIIRAKLSRLLGNFQLGIKDLDRVIQIGEDIDQNIFFEKGLMYYKIDKLKESLENF